MEFNELIDLFFKIENDMNEFVIESKDITNARWMKAIGELKVVRSYDWPTKMQIYTWEALGNIKAMPIGGSLL